MTTLMEKLGNGPHHTWIRNHIGYPHQDCCLIWPYHTRRAGYAAFNLEGKMLSVHRFVCELTHGPASEGCVAAHSCARGHEGCVNPHHLSWKTNSANQLDRADRGENRGREKRSKLTADQAKEIKELTGAEPVSITAARYGVSESAIRQVQTGKTWTNYKTRGPDLTDDQVRRIRQMATVLTQQAIADEMGLSHSVISNILHGRSYAHVADLSIGMREG